MMHQLKKKLKDINWVYSLFLAVFHFRQLVPVIGFNPRKWNLFLKVRPYTMVPYKGIDNLYKLCTFVNEHNIGGDFVECGVFNGGCAALMAALANSGTLPRIVWLFDSFEGLPEPTAKDGGKAIEYSHGKMDGCMNSIGECVGSMDNVKKVMNIAGIPSNKFNIIKGWFQDTLPKLSKSIPSIAILRLDGDWYESTKVCLDNLYDRVTKGGFIIIDDYGCWEGCKKAVDDFLSKHEIEVSLHNVDDHIYYFRKP